MIMGKIMTGWFTSPGETDDYRAYTVGSDGSFVGFRARNCDDDGAAIRWARDLVNDRPIELWIGQRFIARFAKINSASL
jgi:hypothetical protein